MTIRKVGIVGAGTMGSGIAAHLVNSDVPVVLLDRLTPNLSAEAKTNPTARNRLTQTLFDRMANGRPVQLGRPERATLVTIGNTSDDLHLLKDCDWVIEAIVERLEPKRRLMAQLEQVCKPTAILSSNTSGIPINEIAAEFSDSFRARFLGTHFFNPPRYLKLLEVIPTPDTIPLVVQRLSEFARNVLGKGVVICKDTPNFIANRFGAVTGSFVAETALANGYSVADTDRLLGALIGRPKTGYFRLADLVGLDIRASVLNNLYDAIPNDPYRELLRGKTFWHVFDQMIANGWLGKKAGQGFNKKVMVDGQRQFWTLDTNALQYRQPQPTSYPEVEAIAKNRSTAARVRHLLQSEGTGAKLVKSVIFNMLEYAAYTAPKIAYSLSDVDDVVRWGFNYEFGPFELWDALGVAETAEHMEANGHKVADWVNEMLATGQAHFYTEEGVYDFERGGLKVRSADTYHFVITQYAKPIAQNAGASLHTMGDGVLLLEFHSKANTLGSDIFAMGHRALEMLARPQHAALVIGNEGRHFSAGARMTQSTDGDRYEHAAAWLRAGQEFMMALRHAPKPVVTAIQGHALGGGAELSMASWRTVAAHGVRIGLVEFNVGRVPAWSGIKELLRRCVNPIAKNNTHNVLSMLEQLLEQLMGAVVSSSAWEAKSLGYLRDDDLIVMNPDHRLLVAKETGLALVGQDSPASELIYAAGSVARDALLEALVDGKWSEFDLEIGRHLIQILTGAVETPQWVDPWHILDLERTASLSLRFDPRSAARMEHILKTGKPLRN